MKKETIAAAACLFAAGMILGSTIQGGLQTDKGHMEAVAQGHAYWTNNNDGEAHFQWKTPDHCTPKP